MRASRLPSRTDSEDFEPGCTASASRGTTAFESGSASESGRLAPESGLTASESSDAAPGPGRTGPTMVVWLPRFRVGPHGFRAWGRGTGRGRATCAPREPRRAVRVRGGSRVATVHVRTQEAIEALAVWSNIAGLSTASGEMSTASGERAGSRVGPLQGLGRRVWAMWRWGVRRAAPPTRPTSRYAMGQAGGGGDRSGR